MKNRRTLWTLLLVVASLLQIYAEERPKVKIGGALRFNYIYADWDESSRKKGGNFAYDLFRLDIAGSYKKWKVAGEYRFYPEKSGGGMLRYGYLGYEFDRHNRLEAGLTQVPFGMLPSTANSYFLNLNFFVGLEEDNDMGIKYTFQKNGWTLIGAFFKNSDMLESSSAPTSGSRYSYDVGGRNKETNQLNLYADYKWGTGFEHEIGISGMYGSLYNIDTEKNGSYSAIAAHYRANWNRWNLKLQYTAYNRKPKNAEGEDRDVIEMVAYGGMYKTAAKGQTCCSSVSYDLPSGKSKALIRLYNDFSLLKKSRKDFSNSLQNVSGCMIHYGPIETYIEYVLGKNQAWFGNNWETAFTYGEKDAKWNARFNINIGYYF